MTGGSVDENDRELEPEQLFQESFENLFSSTHETTAEDNTSFLSSIKVRPMGIKLLGESDPDLSFPVPMSAAALQSYSIFTESEILLQQLACKLAWTESELAQVIALVSSSLFEGSGVGLDLTRKVNMHMYLQDMY